MLKYFVIKYDVIRRKNCPHTESILLLQQFNENNVVLSQQSILLLGGKISLSRQRISI